MEPLAQNTAEIPIGAEESRTLVVSEHKANECMTQWSAGTRERVGALTTNGRYRRPLCTIPGSSGEIDDDAVKEINPDFDALLVFLANWEAIERSTLGRILTAGQLADVLELERMFALPSGTPEDSR